MTWRIAESLKTLRAQLNAMFPNRSKASDGSIGDAAHSARTSDHNPNGAGVVTAIDITFDNNPADGIGVNCDQLARVLQASGDKRIKYIIWNRRITVKGNVREWKEYTGANPHRHHLHISVSSDPRLYDDASSWNLDGLADNQPVTIDASPIAVLIKRGNRGESVKKIQLRLIELSFLKRGESDGVFGSATERAVKNFQKSAGLAVDGIIGAQTHTRLFS